MRTALMLFLAVGLLAACQPNDAATPDTDDTTAAMTTDQEAADGWVSLFDGETADGWRGYQQDSVPSSWKVEDGALYFDGGEGGRGDIITAEQYTNFELKLEWKISECGNSGIFFRVTEDYGATYFTGPEMQVLDNTCHPDAENGPDRTAGANYGLHAPSEDVSKPAGEWNEVHLIVNGANVEHWLNGTKVVEYELWTDEWKAMVAETKFGAWEQYGLNEAGHIALQDHDDPVWYRNIRIKPLA
ncbi:MAG: DUF1080 domain-containing protein [Bacteroidota bacterium]